MIQIYLRVFRLYYKKYLSKVRGWFLIGVLEIPLYIFIMLCLENLANHIEPLKNGLWLIGLATASYLLRLILELNLLQTAMAYPTRDLQVGLFRHFLRIPPRRYPEVSSGELTNVLFSQITGGWFFQGLVKSAYYAMRIIVLFYFIAQVSLMLGLISTVPVFVLVLLGRTMGRSFVNADARAAETNARFESFVADTLNGILTVKLFNAGAFHVEQARKLAHTRNWRWLKADFLGEGVNSISAGLPQLVIPLFLVVGGYLIAQGQITAAQLVFLYILVKLLNSAISATGILLGYALNYGGQLKVILNFFDKDQEGKQPFPFRQGRMAIQNVNFAYDNHKEILRNVSLIVQPGEKLAIVGQSGMGKSTILALLRGMQFPQHGQVQIDGTKVTQNNAPSLREQIASVSQAAYLFDANLKFNLTMGKEKPASEISDVLRVVGLEKFVRALPDGMDTRFGPNGFAISGGEKARLCLARALLMDRPVLLLDEFTANIDSIREEEILENVLHGMDNKTVVVISHRLSSVRNFPRIAFLEDGRICAEGTHHALLSSVPRYRQMFGEQIL